MLQPTTLHRLGELRKEIKAQPIEAADQQEFQEAHHVVEADRDVADGVEAEETAVFRDNVKVGDQVAILVARNAAGVPFLIGDVIEIVQGPGPLKIQWFYPAVKKRLGHLTVCLGVCSHPLSAAIATMSSLCRLFGP